jgi:hypothetical protein
VIKPQHHEKTYLLALIAFGTFNLALAQNNSDADQIEWNSIILVSKTGGINTSGLDVEYLQNTNQWWGNWLIPVSAGFRTTDLNDKAFKKTNYQSASIGQLTIGLSGYNPLSKSVLLNVKVGVLVGNENLTNFSGETDERIFVGAHSFQGVMIIPQTKLPIVIKAGVYEEALNSKLYNFDIGFKIGVGVHF